MAKFPEITDPQPGDGVQRSILLPFVYAPMIWVGLIHMGTRFMWFLGYK